MSRFFLTFYIFSIEFRIKHEPVEEKAGPFEGTLDLTSLLLVTGTRDKLKMNHSPVTLIESAVFFIKKLN